MSTNTKENQFWPNQIRKYVVLNKQSPKKSNNNNKGAAFSFCNVLLKV